MIRVLGPGDQWDQTLIKDLLSQVDHAGVTVTIIPGRYWANRVGEINDMISGDDNALIVLTSDEAEIFPSQNLVHPNMVVWQQSPHMRQHGNVDRYFPLGYSPQTRRILSEIGSPESKPSIDWFFAGQNTHVRRNECVDALKAGDLAPRGELVETEGFTQGLSHEEYFLRLIDARSAPCPSGVVVLDTFRLYETLEAGVLPIVDGLDPEGGSWGYWYFLFGENPPFPVLKDWLDVGGSINVACRDFPVPQNRVFGWWQKQKYLLRQKLIEDISFLAGGSVRSWQDNITVLVPTSPIESHPDTAIIEETIASIRYHLPDAEILILVDGVREEQEHRRGDYEEYIRRLLWKCNFGWEKVTPIIFDEFSHQSGMTREALRLIRSVKSCADGQVLFVEHDTPLVTDYVIEWEDISSFLVSGRGNAVRFHHEAHVLDEHKHLMLGNEPKIVDGIALWATAQWSQRPHLARMDFYDRMLAKHFSLDAKCMIEDKLYGVLTTGFVEGGKPGWTEFKCWLYCPAGNIKRSYTTDGRGSEKKYGQVF